MSDAYLCRECSKIVTATKNNRYRTHDKFKGERCVMASVEIPPDLLERGPVDPKALPGVPQESQDYAQCPLCGRNAKLSNLGYFMPHSSNPTGGDRCKKSGTRLHYPSKGTKDVPLPGDSLPEKGVYMAQSAAVTDTELGKKLTDADGHVKESSPPNSNDSAPATGTPGPVLALEPGAPETAAPTAPTPSASEDASPTISPTLPTNSRTDPAGGTPPSGSGSQAGSTESTSTSTPSPEPGTEPSDRGPFSLGTAFSEVFLQPFSPFLQPGEILPKVKMKDVMSDRGKEIATRLRETFYAYNNRNSSDNRSAQTTIGPSEAGTPCDRRLAMKMLGIKPVSPQESWAPFVGTAVHAELAKMFEWANGSGSGRYEVEMPLTFPSEIVPRGTGDLLDRVLFMFLDHKLLGRWSLNKLVQEGPSETYRVQIQIYALGAVLRGEKVREVAIIGWPRQESSLDNLYVHVEPFDRKFAEAALKRVERVAESVRVKNQPMHPDGQWSAPRPLEVAREFPTGDDCRWCPFHLKGDKDMERGCPGR